MRSTMPRTSKVSEKSTKGEILDAYRQLLTEASVGESPISPEENVVIASASKETVEKITKDLAQLKLSLTQTISDLTDRLTQEAERFTTIKKAIAIAQNELEELLQIKARAGMLKRMVELQQQKEAEFEKELAAKQRAWEEEQRNHEETMKRERDRDEEEYAYQQQLLKTRDIDERDGTTRAFERELVEKKEEYARSLKELEDLRKKATQFPSELERAVKEAVARAVIKEKDTATVVAKLAGQEADNKLSLAYANIKSLEELVKSQSAEIARLNRELAQATNQVKEIAIAVAEGQRKEFQASTTKTPS